MAVLVASDYEIAVADFDLNGAVTVPLGSPKSVTFTVLVAPENYVDYAVTDASGFIA